MANELTREQVQHLARLGARARLAELEAERRAILRAFPGLEAAVPGPGALDGAADGAGEVPPPRAKRPRRKMTSAERKAQSERMKKIWAERRKVQA